MKGTFKGSITGGRGTEDVFGGYDMVVSWNGRMLSCRQQSIKGGTLTAKRSKSHGTTTEVYLSFSGDRTKKSIAQFQILLNSISYSVRTWEKTYLPLSISPSRIS